MRGLLTCLVSMWVSAWSLTLILRMFPAAIYASKVAVYPGSPDSEYVGTYVLALLFSLIAWALVNAIVAGNVMARNNDGTYRPKTTADPRYK